MNRPGWGKTIWRVAIAIIVLVGIGATLRKAKREIELQNSQLHERISGLEEKLTKAQGAENLVIEQQLAIARSEKVGILRCDVPTLMGSVFLCMLGMLGPGTYWWSSLAAFGYRLPRFATYAAYFMGHLGKYVPGKAVVVIIRAERLRKLGVPITIAVISIFVETLVLMAVGSTMGGICVAISDVPWWMIFGAWGLVLATSLPTLPPIFRLLIGVLAKRRKLRIDTKELDGLTWQRLAQGWLWNVLGWMAMSMSLWMILIGMLPEQSSQLMTSRAAIACTAAATLSVVAGFVSFLPGGAGVREMVIAALLAPLVGSAPALVAAVWMRLVSLTAESIWAGLGMLKFSRSSHSNAGSESLTQ